MLATLLFAIAGIVHSISGRILIIGTVIMDSILAFLAVNGEVSSNTLIMLSIIGNLTVLIGVVFTGYISLKSARISAGNAATLKDSLAEQKNANVKIEKLAEGIDGVAHELKAAKEEGSVARVAAARAEGKLEESEAERDRKGAAAIAEKEAKPTPVIVENPVERPANVALAKEEKQ